MEDWLFKDSEGNAVGGTDNPLDLEDLPQGSKVQWIVIEDNVTESGEIEGPGYPYTLTLTLGSTLACTAGLTALLVIALVARHGARRRHPAMWLFLHYTLVQLLQVALFVGGHVSIQKNGRWPGSELGCRTWLLSSVMVSTLSNWSALSLTIDRLLYAVRPKLYAAYMTGTRAALLALLSWLAATVSGLPVATHMWDRRQDAPDEFILTEVCAINLSRTLSLGLSAAQFFIPAALLLISAMLAAIDAAQTRISTNFNCYIYDTVSSSSSTMSSTSTHTGSTAPSTTSTGTSTTHSSSRNTYMAPPTPTAYQDDVHKTLTTDITTPIAIILATFSLLVWCLPYHCATLAATLCGKQGPCVSPQLWHATQWVLYISCTLTPLAWLVDKKLRCGSDVMARMAHDASIGNSHVVKKDGAKYLRINTRSDHVRGKR